MHYEYTGLSTLFRRTYRELYMRETLFDASKNGWPQLEISLRTLDKNPKDDPIPGWVTERALHSYIVVNYADLHIDHWALNFVERDADGTFVGRITASKLLYTPGTLEPSFEAEQRKCIFAHEWLEVLYDIFNFDCDREPRTVLNREKLYATIAAFERRLPWMDSEEQNIRLLPGLRDLLVSSETIHRLLRESPFQSAEKFRDHYFDELRKNGIGAGRAFLIQQAQSFGRKIHVEWRLVAARICVVIRLPDVQPE